MHLLSVVISVLVGRASLASALPAGPGAPNDPNTCCCCDLSQPAMVCTTSTEIFSCSCLAVQCPEDAPVVYRNLDEEPLPTPPTDPLPTPPAEEEIDCCCCDISQPAISCVKRSVEEGCICPLVLCPPDVPTVYPDTPAITATPVPLPSPISVEFPDDAQARHVEEESPEDKLIDCCCCSIGRGVISCDKRPESEGCFCPMVVCPPGAPTVWEGMPEPTSGPELQVFTRPPYEG